MGNTQVKILVDENEICLGPSGTLVEIQANYGDGVLRNDHDGSYFSRRDERIPAGHYTFVRIPRPSEDELKVRMDAIEDGLKEFRKEIKEFRNEREYEKGRYFVRMDALWIAEQEKFGGSEAPLRDFRKKNTKIVDWYQRFQLAETRKEMAETRKENSSGFPKEPMFPGTKEKKQRYTFFGTFAPQGSLMHNVLRKCYGTHHRTLLRRKSKKLSRFRPVAPSH
jgi:hypothetical protein